MAGSWVEPRLPLTEATKEELIELIKSACGWKRFMDLEEAEQRLARIRSDRLFLKQGEILNQLKEMRSNHSEYWRLSKQFDRTVREIDRLNKFVPAESTPKKENAE